jgi:hypothetical protein
MRWMIRLESIASCCIAIFLASCSEGTSHGEIADVAAPAPAAPSAFNGGDGVPGPWWRHGASREEFNSDLVDCRGRSVEARSNASEDPPDAAYRAFLACMSELAWSRGAPPAPLRVGPG